MQIIQHGEHIDKISLHLIWYALHFINSPSFPYYELEIGMAWADELEAGEGREGWGGVWRGAEQPEGGQMITQGAWASSISTRREHSHRPPCELVFDLWGPRT